MSIDLDFTQCCAVVVPYGYGGIYPVFIYSHGCCTCVVVVRNIELILGKN